MEISTLLVDWDDTLVAFSSARCYAERLTALKAAKSCGLPARSASKLLRIYQHVSTREDRLRHYDRVAYWRETFEEVSVRANDELLKHLVSTYWNTIRLKTRAYPGTEVAMALLKKRGIIIGVVGDSDGIPSNKQTRIMSHRLSRYIDGVFVAGEDVLKSKPSPEIFSLALKTFGVEPRRAAMVGDKIQTDLLGPKELGMWTVWVQRCHQAETKSIIPDFTISKFSQVLKLVKA